jgi:hypothetical protein
MFRQFLREDLTWFTRRNPKSKVPAVDGKICYDATSVISRYLRHPSPYFGLIIYYFSFIKSPEEDDNLLLK